MTKKKKKKLVPELFVSFSPKFADTSIEMREESQK